MVEEAQEIVDEVSEEETSDDNLKEEKEDE